ncbi:MAG: hypothetical protein R3F05_16040 [Planctomycetota bacterium]
MHPKARAAAAHRHDDAGPDRIVCLLCGETYRAITYLHLVRVHGFEGAHPIRDYKARFGLDLAVCEGTRQLAKDTQVRRHKRDGAYWSEARILREIRRLRRVPNGLAHSRVPSALSQAARRRHGTWDAALKAAGVNPMEHRLTGTWSRARVGAELRRHAAGGTRVSATWARAHEPELWHAAYKHHGSWTEALRAARLPVRLHQEPKRWALDKVRAWVLATHAAGGDIRSSRAPAGAVQRVATDRVGPWSAYVGSLGIPYTGLKKRLDWTDAVVLTEIRKRKRAGKSLTHTDVVADVGQALTQQARKRFGSWFAALEAAGVSPARAGVSRPWTRELVIAAIRQRARRGRSLRRVDVQAEDPQLVRAAVKRFPSSWNRAVEAACASRQRSAGRTARRGRHR